MESKAGSKIITDLKMPTDRLTPYGDTLPSFRNFRRTNDAVMVPDRGFVKQLKRLDKNLEVLWDWGSEYWEIWDVPEDGEPYLVTRVQTTSRDYRELGADILLNIQKNRHIGIDKVIEYIDEQNNQIRRRKRQDFMDKISWISRDNYSTFFGIKGKPLAGTAGAPWLKEMPTLDKSKDLRLAEAVKNG